LQILDVALLRQIADHHGADHTLSIHGGCGNPALAIAVDFFNDRGVQRVNLLRRYTGGSHAQIQDWQNLRSSQLKVL
jgi:hypothetical protein